MPETRSLAVLALTLHAVLPLALVVAGLAIVGAEAVRWGHALMSALVATLAFTLFELSLRSAAVARLDVLALLPVVVAAVHRPLPQPLVVALHFGNGVFFAVAWVYATALAGLPANAASGAVWGAVLATLAVVLTAAAEASEGAGARTEEPTAGSRRSAFRSPTAIGASLIGHLVYGSVLGVFYAGGYPG